MEIVVKYILPSIAMGGVLVLLYRFIVRDFLSHYAECDELDAKHKLIRHEARRVEACYAMLDQEKDIDKHCDIIFSEVIKHVYLIDIINADHIVDRETGLINMLLVTAFGTVSEERISQCIDSLNIKEMESILKYVDDDIKTRLNKCKTS